MKKGNKYPCSSYSKKGTKEARLRAGVKLALPEGERSYVTKHRLVLGELLLCGLCPGICGGSTASVSLRV